MFFTFSQVAEKASKFKIDIESTSRHKSAQSGSRKGSREKRPSMISELYTTGSGNRMRGSYGNIHTYHVNRGGFGANRTVSLDQYTICNRRSSDGLQQVTSDNNVYYTQRQHYNIDTDVAYGHPTYATITENEKLSKCEADECSTSCDVNNSEFNRNQAADAKMKLEKQQQIQRQSQPSKYTTNKIINSATSATNSSTKTFMSRLRQLTGRFNFSFDRESKRNVATSKNSIRNNNSNDAGSLAKSAFCCSHKNPAQMSTQKKEFIVVAAQAVSTMQPVNATSTTITAIARNRAYSLDVPIRSRYSSSDDSRKSSRNEDNNHIPGLTFDDNASVGADNKSDAIEGVDSGSYGNISIGNERAGGNGACDKIGGDTNI